MNWWDRLWARNADEAEDAEALNELKVASKRVRRRTDRIIADYEKAEALRLQRRER